MSSEAPQKSKLYLALTTAFSKVDTIELENIRNHYGINSNSSKTNFEDFLCECLKATFDINFNSCRKFRKYVENTEFFNECVRYIDEAFASVSFSKSEQFKRWNLYLSTKLFFSISYCFGYSSATSLSEDDLVAIWEAIKKTIQEHKKYQELRIPIVVLSQIIDFITGSKHLKLMRTLTARTNIYQNLYGLNDEKFNLYYKNWSHYFELWANNRTVKSEGHQIHYFKHFLAYLEVNNFGDDPIKFLKEPRKIDFYNFICDHDLDNKYELLSQMHIFTDWIIDNHMNKLGVHITTKNELKSLSQLANKRRPTESVKEALPTVWIHKCVEILTANDFEWPKTLKSEYFKWVNPETKKVEKVWSPVTTFLFLLMFEIPLRKIQVQQLDSGEGDAQRYNYETQKWEANTSKHANYWLKLNTKRNERGAVTKLTIEGQEMAGLYINTNKTQDVITSYDETSGYIIQWNNPTAIKILSTLLAWQEKYNPVEGPLSYKYVPTTALELKPTKMALECTPARFYLFRNPRNKIKEAPATTSYLLRVWHKLMAELESVLQAEGQDVKITLNLDVNGQPSRSVFTPHGLRVAGLTALYEQGVPIEILSKIVAGHASILMTLHYIKFNPAKISEVLNAAKHKADLNVQQNFLHQLKCTSSFEAAKRFVVANSEEALNVQQRHVNSGAKLNYTGSPIGLCPHNGTACDTGGPIIRYGGKNKENAHGPVEGGPSNCARCRYLLTGTPWLINLWLEGNKKFVEAQAMAVHIGQLRDELQILESRLSDEYDRPSSSPSSIVELTKEVDTLQTVIAHQSTLLDQQLINVHAIHNIINLIKELPSSTDPDSKYSIILRDDNQEALEYTETSRFETLNLMVQAGSIWKHVQDDNFARERDEFINQVIFHAGAQPISFTPLSDHDKKLALNAVADFLLASLNRHELIQLERGDITLENLGIIPNLRSSIELIEKTALESSLKFHPRKLS
ncbi:VPA1269 family protein [Methylophilus luteus]|uniref:VPA1269 family protein n=1 Tax=Methylophilus luteus TaxID=640108 RepID=A0ABW3F646_9PROT